MSELTVENITAAVLQQMSTTPNARQKLIQETLVRHIHDAMRELKLTPAEWLAGIDFLTKVGQMCTPTRQEFILLSDTIGVSALVHLMHEKTAMEESTTTSLLGPFFRENTPRFKTGEQISKKVEGKELVMFGRITDAQGKPLAGAEITVWQTAENGLYDIQYQDDPDVRGIFTTDAQGNYLLRTVLPVGYSIPMDGPVGALVRSQGRHGMRPAHIHFLVCYPGCRELVTALYIDGDVHLHDDTVFGVSEDLVAKVNPHDPACPIQGLPSIRYDFALSKASEADKASGRVGADPAAITRTAAE
jgi:protocatechuate 3,4-dioxygenase beta subunit